MDYQSFQSSALKYWSIYLSQIEIHRSRDQYKTPFSFPTGLVTYEFDDCYACELVGASGDFQGLQLWPSKADSFATMIGQFEDPAFTASSRSLIDLSAASDGGYLKGLILSSTGYQRLFFNRFPHLEKVFESRTSLISDGATDLPLLTIGPLTDNLSLIDCFIVNGFRGIVRLRMILVLCIFSKKNTDIEILRKLRRAFPYGLGDELYGAGSITDSQYQSIQVASQFHNRLLTPGTGEVQLSQFLVDHDQILRVSLGYRQIIHQPILTWMPGTPSYGDESIRPDLLAQRYDGRWDILDLKLPLLRESSLTAGKRRRRRFIVSVGDGLEQLSHYEDYFRYEQNRTEAFRKYGVSISNPRKILIVGTAENFVAEQTTEALRSRESRLQVVDYDSLIGTYIQLNQDAGETVN